jgi:hypothetical protein
MTQHVWVSLKTKLSGLASALNHPRKAGGGERRESI